MFEGNESHHGSRHTAPKGIGVCGSRAGYAPNSGAAISIANTVVRCIARMTVVKNALAG